MNAFPNPLFAPVTRATAPSNFILPSKNGLVIVEPYIECRHHERQSAQGSYDRLCANCDISKVYIYRSCPPCGKQNDRCRTGAEWRNAVSTYLNLRDGAYSRSHAIVIRCTPGPDIADASARGELC